MKRIEEVFKNMSINHEIEDGHAFIEFWTDKAGQDIPVDIDYDGTPEDFVRKFTEYAENYDVDDEVECYINMRGKNGVPNTVRELIDDCQEAKDTLMEIAENLKSAILGEDNVLTEAEERDKSADSIFKALEAALEKTEAEGKNKHGIRLAGENELLCKTETQAEGIADFLEDLGFEDIRTGYYDPKEDEKNGEKDEYTGLYYVCWD